MGRESGTIAGEDVAAFAAEMFYKITGNDNVLTRENAKARLDGGAIPACEICGERIPAADIRAHSSVCDGRGSSEREGARYQMPPNALFAEVRGALIRGGAWTAIETETLALLTDNGYAAAVIDMARGLGLSHADALSAAQSGQMERRADGARSGGAKVGAMRHMEFEDGGDWESMKRRERAALSQREGEGGESGEISVTIRGDGRAFCDCGAEIDWEMDSIERGVFAFRAFGICRGEVRHGRVLAHDDEIEPNTPYVWDFLKWVTLEEYRDGLT